MVLDHELEEEPIELGAFRRSEPRHFLGRQHAGHERRAGHMVRMLARHLLATRFEPLAHHLDLVGLRDFDAGRELPHVLVLGPRLQQLRHVDRLRVVVDHALHEPHVRRRALDFREIGGLVGRDDVARLPRRARLNDRRVRVGRRGSAGGGGDGQEECGDTTGHGLRFRH